MTRVTIEGTITPSTFLGTGKRVTVERTPYISKLIARGYVRVVGDPPAKAEVEQIVDTAREAAARELALTGAPSRTALKEVWVAFLEEAQVPYPANATKTRMIEIWEAHRKSLSDTPDDAA